MKKIYLIGVLVVLIISLSAVSASENASAPDYGLEVDDEYLLCENEDVSDTVIENSEATIDETDGANDSAVIIEAEDFTAYKGNDTYQFRLLDGNESPIANVEANIAYDTGFEDKVQTDDLGIGRYALGLDEGNWTIAISYGGKTANVNVKILAVNNSSSENTSQNDTPVEPSKIAKVVTKNISSTYGNLVNYKIKVLDSSKRGIVGVNVSVTLGGKTITKATDSNGIATFTMNCDAGTYDVFYYVNKKFKGWNTYKVSNKITFDILKWGLKGDVSKNELIKQNMPNNKWVKKAVKATKKGLPLLKIEGGKGKTIFMTAGVHGNEISSQVAMMKMVKYLTTHPIKGTVYIIPFVNVKAISKKVRFTDKDFNRIADSSNTIPNKIVNLIASLNVDAYGDFHTTKPGGAPGQNIVMGSKTPTSCVKLMNYIAKNSKVNKRIYSYAGQQYPGSLFDNVNMKGIPGVICEVVLPHNTITAKSIKISYSMMKNLLKFYSVI